MGMTPDGLKSDIWARNFPLAAVWGWADEMRISPQVLATELEVPEARTFRQKCFWT
jgi:hypothetical protein